MNTRPILAALAALLALMTFPLRAQVPQFIECQGRVAVGALNSNGSGAFKFALVAAAGNDSTARLAGRAGDLRVREVAA